MFALIIVIAATALGAGLLLFVLPAKAWAALTPPRSRWSQQASVAGALLFGGLGLGSGGVLLLSLADLAGGWRSRTWRPVEATIVGSHAAAVLQIRSTNPAFRPAVTYRYEVAGRTHTSQRVAFGSVATPDRDAVAAQLATRFAVGSKITVHVDPRHPADAVIEPGVQSLAVIFTALAAALLGLAAWQLRALLRDWHGARLVPDSRPGKNSSTSR